LLDLPLTSFSYIFPLTDLVENRKQVSLLSEEDNVMSKYV